MRLDSEEGDSVFVEGDLSTTRSDSFVPVGPRGEDEEVEEVEEVVEEVEEEEQDYDDGLIDVNNDQLFDDSLYTESEAEGSRRLSTLSDKIMKKWKRKETKEMRRRAARMVEEEVGVCF